MEKSALLTEYAEVISRFFGNDELLFSAFFDLSEGGSFTEGLFAVSKKQIAVFEKGAVVLVMPIANISRMCCGEYTGSGVLEAFTDNGRQIIVRFSMNCMDSFCIAAEVVNSIISGEDITGLFDKDNEKGKLCPKCKRPFIHNTHTCIHCVDKKGMFKRLWALSKPCRPLYAVLLLLFWVSSVATIVTPMLNKRLVNDVLVKLTSDRKLLFSIVGCLILLSVVNMLVSALRDVCSSKASNLLVRELRNEIFGKLQKMPLGYIEEKKTGDLMQRINNDTLRIQGFIQDIAIMAVNEICLFIAIAVVTFSLDFVMALLIFVTMPVSMWLINRIRKTLHKKYRKLWASLDKLTSRLTDVLNGIKVVKVFGRENDEIERFKVTAGTVRNLTCRTEQYVYTIFPLIKFFMGLGSYLVLLYGGTRVLGGEMSLGELVQFSAYGSYLHGKIEWFSMLPRHFTMAVASVQRVFELLDEPVDNTEGKNISSDRVEGRFDFENVNFGYKSYRRVLRNINASVEKGEMIGLVGHSGAGKSTFINLVMRLYNPDKGQILLDGTQINDYNAAEYKGTMGIVLQESYLFSGTILENIAYAVPDITLEECIIAAKKANAHDFIMELPDGYDTHVGEKGHRLSGGERQRISIARAIASNPKILVLDEATSSVDTETEEKIQGALLNVTKGKTVFAIAHRLSTLKNADRLFVIDEGRIAESGTHDELIEKNGIYASLLKAQMEMAAAQRTIDNTHNTESEKKEKEKETVYEEPFKE